MLSGKCGLVYCHMGAAREGLQPLMDAVALSDVPITQFLPTHVERTPDLINEGARWVAAGGRVDLTCRTKDVSNSSQPAAGQSTLLMPVVPSQCSMACEAILRKCCTRLVIHETLL